MRMLMAMLLGLLLGSTVSMAAVDGTTLLADSDTREAITRLKQAIVAGHRRCDRAALEALYAEDYTAQDAHGGVRTRAQLLDALPTDPEMVEGRYEITTARRWGAVAVPSGHGRMVYRSADGSTRVSEYDSVNVFEQRNGRWWYVAAFLP